MGLTILRCSFLVVAAGLSVYLTIYNNWQPISTNPWLKWLPPVEFFVVMGFAGSVIAIDMAVAHKRVEAISAVFFGLLIGYLLNNIVSYALFPYLFPHLVPLKHEPAVRLTLGIMLCYVCISLLIQTKDDIRFIIPYVEFAKEIKGLKPLILDTSAVIDGRIADVMDTNLIDSPLVMPRFVLAELQNIADSSDRLRRSRGRRGLDILDKVRNHPAVEFKMFDRELPEMQDQPVDMKLVLLAKHLEGKLVTGDYNLNKVARLHNVEVLNLNDLANALKPVFLPGETLDVLLVKAGEESGQGIGYLDDGTMIVVEEGRPHLNRQVRVMVTSVLQTSAGRMIFGRFEDVISKAS